MKECRIVDGVKCGLCGGPKMVVHDTLNKSIVIVCPICDQFNMEVWLRS